MTLVANKRPVPACDLRAQYNSIRDEVRQAIDDVLESQAFINGPQVAELERQIATYCQCQYAIGCSSGSDALLLPLMAMGIGPGDEVITTPFTFFATVGAIARLGAKPVFVDIEPRGFNIDPKGLEAAVTPKTRAIIPVHLFGQMAEMNPILDFAKQHKLAVIEDAAQAIGAEYYGHRAGSMGDVGCLSFFPSKNLGAIGDGGMVVTNNKDLADKMRVLRTHGAAKKYYHTEVGGNFRLDTIHAAVLLVKLRYLDQWSNLRQRAANQYRELLESGPAAEHYTLPDELSNRRHVYNQFIVRTPKRDRLLEAFREAKIGSAVYYPSPMHVQECFSNLEYKNGDFPVSEHACLQTCALPMFPEITEEQQQTVAEVIASALTS